MPTNEECTSELRALPNREAWLTWRRQHVGASDAAAILGMDDFRGPLDVWASKVRGIDTEPTEHMEWGRYIEKPVVEYLHDRTKVEISFLVVHGPDGELPIRLMAVDGYSSAMPDIYAVGAERGLIACSPDGFCELSFEGMQRKAVLQIKNVSHYGRGKWSEGLPDSYSIQVQTEMYVMQTPYALVAALFGGCELGLYLVPADTEMQANIVSYCARWWAEHVVAGVEPPWSPQSRSDTWKLLHPRDNGETVELPGVAADLWSEVEALKSIITEKEQRVEALTAQIRSMIGDGTFGEVPGRDLLLSLKTTERKGFTVKPTSFRVLRRVKQDKGA